MAKRFTDTEKFNDPWYRRLSLLHKVIWEYLLAECNHAGILEKLDLELMSFKIGEDISLDDLKSFEERIVFINEEVIFIPKFITFQYGPLNPQSKVHASVLKELEKWEIQAPYKTLPKSIDRVSIGLANPIDTLKDKEKDKDKDINTSNKQIDTIDIDINNSEKTKKTDPYINPINDYFIQEYQKAFNNKPYLMHNQRTKLTELATEIDNFRETIPIVIEKLKNVEFSLPNFTANYIWLLKDDNYLKVLSGTYDKKMTEWEKYCEERGVDEYGN